MITLYSGTPGAGKSLHLASRLCNWMKHKKAPIIGNFSCNFSSIKKTKGSYLYIDNVDLKPERLLNFSKNYSAYVGRRLKEGEILLVIDEAQLLFNSREWVKSDRAEWCAFFTQHRKLGYEVILIAQFDRMLDRQIRSLIEYEWIHRKVSNFGAAGKIISAFTAGKLFVAVKVWYPMKEKVGSEFFVYHKKYSTLYDTYALFSIPK
jgi:zona occludens toxin (predicted ATPase)